MERYQVDNVLVREKPQGTKRIGWLEQAVHADDATLATYSATDFEWLTQMLGTMADLESYGTFSLQISAKNAAEYRYHDGAKLLGWIRAEHSDGTPYWQLMVGEYEGVDTRQAQLNLIRHKWLTVIAQKLVRFIAELTPAAAKELKPGVLDALPELARVLVALDKINSNEAQDFEEQLNPHVDIFGDISHDVLASRLKAATVALATPKPKGVTLKGLLFKFVHG